MSIHTLKVTLLYGGHASAPWECVIEIKTSASLDDLHLAIQRAVDFDNDHMYEFFIGRTDRSRDRIRLDEERDDGYGDTIDSLFPLPERKKLFYLFDYGDHWLFQVSKVNRVARAAQPKVKYPRVVMETGTKPQQYPKDDWG